MLLKGGRVVYEKGIKELDIRIKGEKIASLAKDLAPAEGEEVINVAGKLIFPGIIDSHTHFNLHSRGTVTVDDFYRGGISAAFGGVTTVIDYADQESGSLIKGLEVRKAEARDAVIDYSFHLVLNNNFQPEGQSVELNLLREAGVSSLKIFTTYKGLYLLDDDKLAPLFKAAREAGLLITVHAEKDEIISQREETYRSREKLGVRYHPEIRPGIAEGEAVKHLIGLVEEHDCPLYIVHLSSREGYQEVLQAREKGLDLYVETTPHYLLLNRKLLEGADGRLNLMTPPLRGAEDNETLWEGVSAGIIDVIATDHCAFTAEQKAEGNNSLDILPGIPGVETLLPLIYTYGVEEGRITLSRLVELLSANPARLFGLYPEKGSLQVGTDADLVVYDPGVEWELRGDNLHSGSGYTPYQGMRVKGKSIMTILRGKVIVEGDKFTGRKGDGRFIKAGQSSAFSRS